MKLNIAFGERDPPNGVDLMKMSIQQIRGAAIMLALWALFLLSALVISWALDINSRLSISGEGTRMLKAEAAACSGSEIALHPFANPGSSNLSGQMQNGASYEARLTGEGGRLDINWLAGRGDNADQLQILRRYLENKGIDLNERDTMVDSLLDWIELDTGLHHLNAPPESDDYHPAHEVLKRIEELKKVAGWGEFTSNPGWDDDFTVNTQAGIDLQWASRDVLLALPGMNEQRVDAFLERRRGPDGIDGTQDDTVFQGDEALVALGFNPRDQQQFEQVRKFLSPSKYFRVVSVGRAGNATRTVQMVFQKGKGGGVAGGAPSVITWKEF